MVELAAGAAGAALFFGVFLAGGVCGWKLHKTMGGNPIRADPLMEEERARLKEEQEAFRRLQNYTVEDAYGMRDKKLTGSEDA